MTITGVQIHKHQIWMVSMFLLVWVTVVLLCLGS